MKVPTSTMRTDNFNQTILLAGALGWGIGILFSILLFGDPDIFSGIALLGLLYGAYTLHKALSDYVRKGEWEIEEKVE